MKFFGPTDFAPTGVWVGIALDVPKGKNNGTVQGKAYFTCPDNHGMFLRSGMVSVVKNTSPSQKGTSAKKTAIPTAGPSTSSGPQRSKLAPPGSLSKGSPGSSPGPVRRSLKPPSSGSAVPTPATVQPNRKQPAAQEVPKPQPQDSPPQTHTPIGTADVTSSEDPKIRDLEEKLSVLQHKRQDDKAKIKELERYKAQCQQVGTAVTLLL